MIAMPTARRPRLEVPPCGCGAPGQAEPGTCYCSVEHLLKVIRRRYALALLNAIHRLEPARYRDLASVVPQASSATLAETLLALEAASLVTRNVSDAIPTTQYRLTPGGSKLLRRLRPLLEEVQR